MAQAHGLPAGPMGLFGGSFDPVHNGHLHLAGTALRELRLASVRWIPSGQPGHRNAPLASAAQRLAMLKLALRDCRGFCIDESELHAAAPTFTVNTLERERAAFGPDAPLVFLIGADQLMLLHQWREWQRLLDMAHFGVAERPGHPIEPASMPAGLAREYHARTARPHELALRPAGLICVFPIAPLDISSSAVRDAIAAGRPPRDRVPARVLDYIASNDLYQIPPSPTETPP